MPVDPEPSFIRTRLRQIGQLVTGNFANAAVMLVATAIAARALGPEAFGLLALIVTLGRTVERLLRFESWQPLIRYAAAVETDLPSDDPSRDHPARERLAALYSLGLWMDATTAIVAAVVAVAVAAGAGSVFGLPENASWLMAIFAVAIAFNWSGMPTAVLRLGGRFDWLACYQFVGSGVRVALALVCWLAEFGLMAFVVVWMVSQVVNSVFLFWLAMRCMREAGVTVPWRVSPRRWYGRFPGFARFAVLTNLSTSLRTLTVEADTLIVGAFAGTSAAGFYFIAKRLAKVAQQIGAHVQAVLYPDVARMWARGEVDAFVRTTRQVQTVLTALGLAGLVTVWVVGEPALRLVFGDAYAGALPILLTQILAVVFILHAAPSRSSLLAMGKPGFVLATMAVGAPIFIVLAIGLVNLMGAVGASWAHVALAAFTAVVFAVAVRAGTRGSDDPLPVSP